MCNMIEHWAYLRRSGIRQAQYTETWTCHLHRESRLHNSYRHNTTPPLQTLAHAVSRQQQQQEVQQLLEISAIARTIALEERMMVTPQMSLLDLTVESGIPGEVMRHLYAKIILCLFPVMTDFLWLWFMMDSNITCDEDSNKHVTRIRTQHVTKIRI